MQKITLQTDLEWILDEFLHKHVYENKRKQINEDQMN